MCGLLGYLGKSVKNEKLEQATLKISHRGPDNFKVVSLDNAFLGFQRLSIMDLSGAGHQPFANDTQSKFVMCNGEIFNHKQLKASFPESFFKSESDCEVLLPMLTEYGIEKTCKMLDAEFAFVFYDKKKNKMMAARDPIGIRPLFYGYPEDGEILFASEVKAFEGICDNVNIFPPGFYYDGSQFHQFRSMIDQAKDETIDEKKAISGIKLLLEDAVKKRLDADAPVSFLLSGGLDSSLVCAIAAKHSKGPIKTFSIGTEYDAIDNKYAEQVAEYIGAEHTTVTFDKQQALDALEEVVRTLETWDVTTIRASVGMYLVCKYIREHTGTKVLLTGEVSDEIFGYKYTDYAPSAEAFQKEAQKRVKELHMYDVLRADRCISAHSLEARVPFGDLAFVDHVMSIPPELKMNRTGHGKYLLRSAFAESGLLPDDILFREKAAFSDAVGHSLVDDLIAYAESEISDEQFKASASEFKHGKPKTKEALLYRKIFEKYYKGKEELIPSFWLPNKDWENCDVDDPSARLLPNYGKSGS